jgi:uncharacterized protein YndB with AHSA1/START domain
MSVVNASVEIDAPPEKVWTVVSDPRNLPRWDRHIVRVEGVPKAGIKEGSQYATTVRFMGVRAGARSTVVELRPNRYAKVHVRGALDADVETWLDPLDGGRTRLRHRVNFRFKGGPLGELAARAVNALGAPSLLKRGVEEQKRQAEGG